MNEWIEWLATRPQNVQNFAKAHPELEPGACFDHDGQRFYFMGYAEFDDGRVGMLITPINPFEDYDAAVAARQHICPDHF